MSTGDVCSLFVYDRLKKLRSILSSLRQKRKLIFLNALWLAS